MAAKKRTPDQTEKKRAMPAHIVRAKNRIHDLIADIHSQLNSLQDVIGWDDAAATLAGRDIVRLGKKMQTAIAKLNAL